jgi:hypothetical protein
MRLDRQRALEHVTTLVAQTWAEFDTAREFQPSISPNIASLLTEDLPRTGVDAIQALDEAASVLDTTLSQARPR